MTDIVIIEKELSYLIVQAAYEVHNVLGPGYPEKIYEEAMARELTMLGVEAERQKRVVIEYKGESLGEFFFWIMLSISALSWNIKQLARLPVSMNSKHCHI